MINIVQDKPVAPSSPQTPNIQGQSGGINVVSSNPPPNQTQGHASTYIPSQKPEPPKHQRPIGDTYIPTNLNPEVDLNSPDETVKQPKVKTKVKENIFLNLSGYFSLKYLLPLFLTLSGVTILIQSLLFIFIEFQQMDSNLVSDTIGNEHIISLISYAINCILSIIFSIFFSAKTSRPSNVKKRIVAIIVSIPILLLAWFGSELLILPVLKQITENQLMPIIPPQIKFLLS